MRRLLAALALLACIPIGWGTPPEATAYQITVDHAGVTTSGGTLALQLTPRWTVTLPDASSYPLIVGNRVYALAGGLLYALDVQTGATLWGPTQAASGIGTTYDAGKVFVVSNNGLLSSFDAASGAPGWSVQLPGQYSFSSPPTASNGAVYVGGAGSGGTLYAVNETNGAVLWTASVANGDNSSPAIGPNAVYVSYACLNTYSFNLTTGAQNWLNPASCEGGGGDTPVYANGRLYARDILGDDIFDAQTGTILGSFLSSTPPVVGANTAYYLNAGTLSAVNVATSTVRWTFAGDGGLTSAPIAVDQTVIIGSSAGTLYGLDELSGRVTWQVSTGLSLPSGVEYFGPANGFAIADGVLVVPAGKALLAYPIFGPPAPTNVTAASAPGGAVVSWTAAAGASTYNVYVATQPGAEPFTAAVTGVTGSSALVPNLVPGTTYYFTVKTAGPSGISAASNEASAVPIAPAPASHLTATAGVGSVTLSWAASSNATSYNVYLGAAAGGESSTATLTSITTNTATLSGLMPGSTYYLLVKAVANGATSVASNEVVVIPAPAAAPTMPTATPQIGGTTLTWVAATGATTYQLYVGTSAGGEASTPAQTGITTNTTTISNLNASSTYYFIVRSVVGGVTSGPSSEISVKPLSDAGPQNLVLTPGVGQIVVSWNASPGATQYSVFMGTAAGGEAATPVQTVPGLQVPVTGLSSGSKYYFYVQAQTPIGPSMPSVESSATPLSPPGPTNLSATAGANEVTLTWSAAANAMTYDVYAGTSPGGEAATPVQAAISGLSTVISGLTGGTQYYYTVRAETPAGQSSASNEANASPTASGKSGGGALDPFLLLALGLLVLARGVDRRLRAAPAELRGTIP